MSQPPFRSLYRSSLILVYHLSASDHRCRQRLSTRHQLHRRTPIECATLDLFSPNETLQCTTRRRPCHRKRHLTSVQSRTGACRSPCTRDRRRSPLLPPILAGARDQPTRIATADFPNCFGLGPASIAGYRRRPFEPNDQRLSYSSSTSSVVFASAFNQFVSTSTACRATSFCSWGARTTLLPSNSRPCSITCWRIPTPVRFVATQGG